jgi:HAMP domain-containing protein
VSRSNDRLGEHAPPSSTRRRRSVFTRLAAGTVLLVSCITLVTVMDLTQREWRRLVDSKRTAADMVANLFAGTVAGALERGDLEALKTSLDGLRSNAMIVYAAAFATDNPSPLAEYHNGRGDGGPPEAARDEGEIQVQSSVHARSGTRLGSVAIRVSLAREVQAFQRTRARLFGFGALFAAALASLMVVIVRRALVAPLGHLESAALQLAGGSLRVVPADRDDELGSLSRAFNVMATNIDDRERRITVQNRRIQALFDNMAEAIVVFGADRLLSEERSRSAERWLDGRPGNSIVDILYPEDESLDGERQAFDAWLDRVFVAPADGLRELLERAPRTITRHVAGATMHFELTFRLAEQLGTTRQLMLIACDVTERRRLERSLLEKERQHARELSALRRLSLGSAQLFGSFLEMGRRRLVSCQVLLPALPQANDGGEAGNGNRETIDLICYHLSAIGAEARCFDLEQVEAEVVGLESALDRIRSDGYALLGTDQGDLSRGFERIARCFDDAEKAFVEESGLGVSALDQIAVRRSRLMAVADAAGARNDRVRRLVHELCARPLFASCALFPEAVLRWAQREGKKVQLVLDLNGAEVPLGLARVLGSVLSDLLRRAVVDGIERDAERLERGKPALATVRIWARSEPSGTIIGVEDDGRGFEMNGRAVRAVREELSSAGYRIDLVSASPLGTRIEIAPGRDQRIRERHAG